MKVLKQIFPFRKNITTILILSFVLILLMPVFLITYYSNIQLKDNIESRYYNESRTLIEGFDANLIIYFNELEKLTTQVFKSREIQELLGSHAETEKEILERNWMMKDYFSDLIGGRTDIIRAQLYGVDGLVYEVYRYEIRNIHVADREVIRTIAEGNGRYVVYGSRSIFRSNMNDSCLTVGRQIKDLDTGEVKGYILFDISYNIVDEILGFRMDDKNILIVKDSGQILYDKNARENISKTCSECYSLNGNTAGEKILKIESKKMDWTYYAIIDTGNISGIIDLAARKLLIVSSWCFLISLVIASIIAAGITRPLKRLEKAMEQAEENYFSQPLEIKGTFFEEVRSLTGRFNTMQTEIQRLIESEKDIEKKKAQQEYRALQLQITPHFLYNALESINSLAQIHNVQDISRMVLSLARIFKYNQSYDTTFVNVSDEIEHVKNYCYLQAVVYQNRFWIVYDVDEKVGAFKVLKFILQPLVENAIHHGMKEIQSDGIIRINVDVQEGFLYMCVSDNGSGMTHEKLSEIRDILNQPAPKLYELSSAQDSIGLVNVHLRLRMIYGNDAGIEVNSLPGEGTGAVIKIPI